MKIGIRLGEYTKHLPLAEAAKALALDGYEAIDYSDPCDVTGRIYTEKESLVEKELLEQARIFAENGLAVSQIHGPWRYPPLDGDAAERAVWLELMKRSVRVAAYLGAPYVVVHPLMPFGANSPQNPGKVIDINAEHYARLCDYAKGFPVSVCLENMPFPDLPLAHAEQIRDFADGLGRKNLKICLDTGHTNVCSLQPGAAVRLLGNRLATLHIHDNHGDRDDHLSPYEGTVDFRDFAAALHEIGFSGSLSAETKACAAADKSTFRSIGKSIAADLIKMAKNNFS